MPTSEFRSVHLTREGVSVLLTSSLSAIPRLVHWGGVLGDLDQPAVEALTRLHRPGVAHSSIDEPRALSLVPENVTGFTGLPGLEGFRFHRRQGASVPRLREWTWRVEDDAPDAIVDFGARDGEAGWDVEIRLELTREGLLRTRTTVVNAGDDALCLTAVRSVLPVGPQARELLDLTGRWCKERSPQRHPFVQGAYLREGRHGRTGHDASLVLVAGEPGFSFSKGELWGVHTAWSGDHATYAQRTPEGESLLGGGELLGPGEVVLEPGESYTGPWLFGSYAGSGLDEMSARFHAWLRRHNPRSRSERPVLVNTWEATYFEHDLEELTGLAEHARAVGVERFVLDDGWFKGRRHDRAGLGDWTVDTQVWPDGLAPLIDAVKERGLEFGLWVEPEMINVDSDLARAHPDWILRGRADLPPDWRHQQVLDLQVPGAYAHVRDQMMALLADNDIAYLKWDHNRDLIDVAHSGRPAVRGQTLAFYRLLDELREAHPALEIETCASGGGRVDLEVLTRTDRIWPSDTIDALERQHLQRWTSLLVPPEMMGSHIGRLIAHTTGRSHRLGFRAATALLYQLGIEWDVRRLDESDSSPLARWVELHKRIRPLMATGSLVHPDHPDPAVMVTGIVSADRSEAWYVVATVGSIETQHPAPVRLTGLDGAATYRITGETPHRDQHRMDLAESWMDGSEELEVTGAALDRIGVRMPVLAPETAEVLRVVRIRP